VAFPTMCWQMWNVYSYGCRLYLPLVHCAQAHRREREPKQCAQPVVPVVPTRSYNQICAQHSQQRPLAPAPGLGEPTRQQVLQVQTQPRLAHMATATPESSYWYREGDVGSGQASPPPQLSTPGSDFHSPGPSSPQQPGVVYDDHQRGLQQVVTQRTGPQSPEEGRERWIATRLGLFPGATYQEISALYDRHFQGVRDVDGWRRLTQR